MITITSCQLLLLASAAFNIINAVAVPQTEPPASPAPKYDTFTSPDGYPTLKLPYNEVKVGNRILKVYYDPQQQSSDAQLKTIASTISDRNENTCDDSSFVNKTTSISPLLNDCQNLIGLASVTPGSLKITISSSIFPGYRPYMTYGSCTFGAQTANFWGARVGNTDLMDLVRDSNARFNATGRIGAEGEMGCQTNISPGSNPRANVKWAIYNGVN